MKSVLLVYFLLLWFCATGCDSRSRRPQINVDPSRATRIYNQQELTKLIALGMTLTDVTNTFGLPGSAVKTSEHNVMLNYMFPFKPESGPGPQLTGFSIHIQDGRVIRWSPITGMTFDTSPDGPVQGAPGEQLFQIFLSTDKNTNLVNAVESKGIADAGSLKGPPDLTFKAKVFSGDAGKDHPGEQSVILVLSEHDASQIKSLTETNFGRRLLIVCRNKIVLTATISVPLASKQIIFSVRNPEAVNIMRGE